jgi:hypothetical protein
MKNLPRSRNNKWTIISTVDALEIGITQSTVTHLWILTENLAWEWSLNIASGVVNNLAMFICEFNSFMSRKITENATKKKNHGHIIGIWNTLRRQRQKILFAIASKKIRCDFLPTLIECRIVIIIFCQAYNNSRCRTNATTWRPCPAILMCTGWTLSFDGTHRILTASQRRLYQQDGFGNRNSTSTIGAFSCSKSVKFVCLFAVWPDETATISLVFQYCCRTRIWPEWGVIRGGAFNRRITPCLFHRAMKHTAFCFMTIFACR